MQKVLVWVSSLLFIGVLLALAPGAPNSEEVPTEKQAADNKEPNSEIYFPDPGKNACMNCHSGIEPIRDPASGMMQAIYKKGHEAGLSGNDCVVCHGGNPNATTAELAHQGTAEYFTDHPGPKEFYPDPGSPWINANTCGMCHEDLVSTQFTSLMFTEAGKIQGTTWGFGGIQGYEHNVANLETQELAVHERLGTDTYKKYMASLKEAEPQVFPGKMSPLPEAPSPEEVDKNPQLAVYTYLRAECQRCHIGVKGRSKPGDFRGMGCSSCHIPYSNKGYYEGEDPTIPEGEAGHLLVHSIQGTREAKVTVHGHEYSGIPVKTCQSCHNRGRRIGVSYEGLMETAYKGPFMSNGDDQSPIHTKQYLHLQPDVHLTKGMLCQDCHTSADAHSYGDLSGAIQGAVEIECQDCHGTIESFPWELPIGYGDEITGPVPAQGPARGTSDSILAHMGKGTVVPAGDGYLISARGNPLPHVTREGEEVIVHSAGGADLRLRPLRLINEENELNLEARTAMVHTPAHMDKMECYACHATWAPQCYGCHINVDYSSEDLKLDWVAIAGDVDEQGLTPDALLSQAKTKDKVKDIEKYLISGETEEQRSYLRWEDPALAVNADHRISPAVPGCQTTVTVKGPDGKVKLLNHIFKIPGVEGAGPEGQLAIDMATMQPHTIQLKARSCESCHANPKAMGFGIEGGELYYPPDTNFVVDLADASGKPIPQNVDTQFTAIPNLPHDWSRFLDETGKQLQTVGHHFSGSRPLNKEELKKLDRRGVCTSCHQTIPDKDLAVSLMHHVAEAAGEDIDSEMHDSILRKSTRLAAWVQVLGAFLLGILVVIGARWGWKKWRKRSA